MDLRRLRAGEWIAALSGAAMIVSLFLPWYGEEPAGREQNAWEAFAVVDVLLLLAALMALALFALTVGYSTVPVPIALSALTAIAGLIAAILVLIRAKFEAGPGEDPAKELGLYVGLASAAAISLGGWVSMRDERLSKPGRATDSTGRPGPPPPEIEEIPAPPAESAR